MLALDGTLEAFKRAKAEGMQPLLILSYGNRYYEGGTQPTTTEGHSLRQIRKAGWQKTTNAVSLFEVWNKWNIGSEQSPSCQIWRPAN